MKTKRTGLAARLMTAQVLVIVVGAVTLLVTAALAAPHFFSEHLTESGVTDPTTLFHAEQAFNSAFLIALALGTTASLITAGIISWVMVKRVVPPLQRLAEATESVAAGNYDIAIPDEAFGAEFETLSTSFARMAHRLKEVDASRTQMLTDLAHESGTPLATLEVFVDGMEDGIVPINPDTYSVLRAQITRLHRLTRDIRDAATADEHSLAIHAEPMNVRRQIDLAVELARPQYQAKGIQLSATVNSLTRQVLADEERLQQVLTNVLSNALRHTPNGGHVQVDAMNRGRMVQISVTDDGDGLPESEQDAIFERFHRVDPARTITGATSGSGLGLTIARSIITDHGGTITASSPGEGQGTMIIIRLPAAH
jgi:two-component system sensor histidine kinase BaeS